jgi:hypothetical protein
VPELLETESVPISVCVRKSKFYGVKATLLICGKKQTMFNDVSGPCSSFVTRLTLQYIEYEVGFCK